MKMNEFRLNQPRGLGSEPSIDRRALKITEKNHCAEGAFGLKNRLHEKRFTHLRSILLNCWLPFLKLSGGLARYRSLTIGRQWQRRIV